MEDKYFWVGCAIILIGVLWVVYNIFFRTTIEQTITGDKIITTIGVGIEEVYKHVARFEFKNGVINDIAILNLRKIKAMEKEKAIQYVKLMKQIKRKL